MSEDAVHPLPNWKKNTSCSKYDSIWRTRKKAGNREDSVREEAIEQERGQDKKGRTLYSMFSFIYISCSTNSQ